MSKKSWRGRSRRRENNEPDEPDTTNLIGTTDLQNKDVQIYLVKMPGFLADQFKNPESGIVGRLRIPEQGSQPKNAASTLKPDENGPRIFLDKHVNSKGNIAISEFNVEFQTTEPNMLVFSGNKDGKEASMRLEGTVVHQCMAKPKMTSGYRSVNKIRTRIANTATRELLRMDDRARKAAEREALKPMSMMETAKQREDRKKQKEDSRRHLDVPDEQWREIARVAVFKAFEIQAHYSADELAKDLQEPVARIRPIIGEVCSYNKAGPFSGKYELKDEFKTEAQRFQKKRELENHRLSQIENVKKRREERAEMEKDLPPAKKARPS